MYDTTSALCTLPPGVGRRATWGKILITEDPSTGERRERQVLTTPKGLQLTLMAGCTLIAARSLPKALYGTNVRELAQAELPAALTIVDQEIAVEVGADLPPFASWSPVRVDYCENVQLGSEAAVRTTIHRLRDVSLPHKGRPVAGDSGTSVAWPRGAIRPKVYGKRNESGEALAEGVLRYEVGVFRRGTFNKELDRLPGSPVTLAQVLTPALREQVLAKYSDLFGRCLVGKEELSDRRFAEEFLDYFGPSRTVKLIGFCLLWGAFGSPSMKDMAAGQGVPGMTRATVYRYFRELRKFRLAMIAKGYDRPEVTGIQAWDNAAETLESDEKLRTFIASLQRRLPSRSVA